ncbi:MAG: AAC(3) family N-acetyltransferase [Candidatus Sumerlaeaceae bacterium]|nr:AAC(3) family N-acetyltransferase [Candidatus Sumerlaeaceae bacterium]
MTGGPTIQWTVSALTDAFCEAGIEAGDNLVLHSSYKCLGAVEGGPGGVVEALLSALGPAGNLMVPTFTYSLPMWSAEPFDLHNSKSRVGAITEAVRLHPRALRSFHPTHSVAVIGPDAEEIVRNHLHSTPIGLESPFGRMVRRGAKILMLGTHQDTNSSLHYCEVAANLPYIRVAFREGMDYELAWFFNENGQIEYAQVFEVPGCSRGFRVIEGPLRERGVLRDVLVGGAPSQLLEMARFVPVAVEILSAEPSLLLCNTVQCQICGKRREFMKKNTG